MIKQLLFLIILLFSANVWAGTSYYVDCTDGGSNAGTFANPWQDISDINGASLSTGDDVYFAVNTTCTADAYLTIDWDGTSGDRVIIGAYYGDGQFGLNGNSRPIIDGNNNTVPSSATYVGLITQKSVSPVYTHITVQDLRVQYSGKYGINFGNTNNMSVDNCYLYRNSSNSILYGKIHTSTISNNTVENSGYPTYPGTGAAIEVTGGEVQDATYDITVTGNTVFASKHEGIGFYKKVKDSIMEYNAVYDARSYHLYVASSLNNIVRYNIAYNYSGQFGRATAHGISLGQEAQRTYCYGGSTQIYGNLISSQSIGISLGCGVQDVPGLEDCICHDNTVIYNNTLVDNNTNIRYWRPTAGDDIIIKNNISWSNIEGEAHLGPGTNTSTGITWGYNNFFTGASGDASIPGSPANTDAVSGDPNLEKQSGWHSLSAGVLDGTEFQTLVGGAGIDAGVSIASYNNRITDSDYTASPIEVTIEDILTSQDIGAWEFDSDSVSNLEGVILMGIKID